MMLKKGEIFNLASINLSSRRVVGMVDDLAKQDEIAMELDSYKGVCGLFSNPLAIRQRTMKKQQSNFILYI